MSDDRISKDLKKAIRNRKGVKFKENLGKLIFKGSMSAVDQPKKSTDMKKKKINKDIDTMMELIKTPEFKNKSKQAFRLATKLDKPVPGGIKGSLDEQKSKNSLDKGPADPDRLFGSTAAQKKNMGGKMMKPRPVTMNMGGQVDGVEDLTTEMDITE